MFGINPTGQPIRKPTPGGTKPGADGREIELQNNGVTVQWRYRGFREWRDLITLSALRGGDGPKGAPGIPGEKGDPGNPGPAGNDGKNGFIGPTGPKGGVGPRGFPGDRGVPGKDGIDGTNGTDGREIELQTSKTHIQWRYVGELKWKDLIALKELKGEKGDQGFVGPQGERGLRGPQGWGGPAGTKGDTGAQGPIGPQGDPGTVESIVAGNNIDVDDTDPANPIVSVEALTKADVGLPNVDNTSDADKPISDDTQAALDLKADLVAGKVPASQLPAYVDDVIMVANFAALPVTGEADKIYVTEDTNITYRWNGSGYTEISASLALGETSSTAYRGDRGKIAYDHSQTIGNPHGTTKGDIGLGNADNTSDLNKPISTAQQVALDTKVDENAPITPDTVGDETHIPIITYDAKGLITSATEVEIVSGSSVPIDIAEDVIFEIPSNTQLYAPHFINNEGQIDDGDGTGVLVFA